MPTLNALNGEKPRQIAARVLAQRRAGDEFAENLLDRALERSGLSGLDRGLCRELVLGVVRWQATLDWLIMQKTQGRTQKAGLQDLLRLGLYQIFWLDRIPAHAAVNETVEQARRDGFGAQAGFVNAVLRGYLREAEATKAKLNELKASNPALGWSHPEWLVKRWQDRLGAERSGKLLDWNNTPARAYARLNTLRCDATRLIEQWREEGVDYDFFTRDWTGENAVFELKAHPPLATLKSFRDGWFYVQDPSTLLAVHELEPRPGEAILDLCAAPGGKTTFIAQLVRNESRIVAQDVSPARLKLVQENCTRLGVTCVEAVSPATFHSSTFDKILLDAPCSNTGVMRRRVDLRWRIRLEAISRLRQSQMDLLRQAAGLLKSGGILIYSTCSLEPEENGELVKQFLSENATLKLEREREVTPFGNSVDGAYVARMQRA
jgi:16S rRNA (cytosine967-C5)-methyltransferase